MKNMINWFEIPVADMPRAKAFYSAIFQIEMPEMEMSGSLMAFFPWDSETLVSGSLTKHEMIAPGSDGTVIYFNCGDDLTPFLDRVEPAGGKIVVPRTQISEDHGYFALFLDTEGNRLGFHSRK